MIWKGNFRGSLDEPEATFFVIVLAPHLHSRVLSQVITKLLVLLLTDLILERLLQILLLVRILEEIKVWVLKQLVKVRLIFVNLRQIFGEQSKYGHHHNARS